MALQPTIKSLKRFSACFVVALAMFSTTNQALADISQTPLLVGGGNVPGSLALTPSVEYPTILTMANLGTYANTTLFTGYFDSDKCYTYYAIATDTTTDVSRFVPANVSTDRNCSGLNTFSGNYLNWAATQTIDPFRSALTGGYRVVDTETLTVLQKARNTGQSGTAERTTTRNFGGTLGSQTVRSRIQGLGAKMQFTLGSAWSTWCKPRTSGSGCDNTNKTTVEWDGSNLELGKIYNAYVRAEVCKSSLREANCVQYGTNWKPEGLIQQYNTNLRYSVFGYLNDSDVYRDGGVLRAAQKYVGPKLYDGTTNNTAKEWDPDTGILTRNPDNIILSMGTTIADSGVINYVNKFGELTTNDHKALDPVSELYYTAIRYFKGLGPVPSYSIYTPGEAANARYADGFPVIDNWAGLDPISYACQKNVILGIGDTNTHKDKDLPSGSEATSTSNEPTTKPAAVVADTSVNVVAATRKVQDLEALDTNGINLQVLGGQYTGNQNSAYIAGLAYDSHTKDLRPDTSTSPPGFAGKQTISTYWVDVRENEDLKDRARNQYWLAAKYGGFTVPSDYGDPYTRTTRLPDTWWTKTGEALLSTGDKRPTNFFVASDATNMVESLKSAFAQIATEVRGTTTSLATNSTQLETGSAVFQSQFDSSNWSGDLLMKTVNSSGVVANTATWSAAALLDARSGVVERKVFTSNTLAASTDQLYSTSTTGTNFSWGTNLDDGTKTALKTNASGSGVSDTEGEARVNYLRGDRTQERTSTADTTHPYRQRGSRLGDIVNSDPQYIAKQDYGYNLLRTTAWGSAGSRYLTYRASTAYQNRTPLIVVGANDGMLHGFNASAGTAGGTELFAYVPRTTAANLYELTDPNYSHRYYVDGTPAASDAYINNSWKSIVVGTTGAGGKSVFALDVTAPDDMDSSKVMWEFTAPDLGSTIEQPAIVALANGKFGVVVSSGYSNAAVTSGQVWILDAADGTVLKKFTLPTTGYLGEPLAVDLNNDRMTDRIYVGDTQGNLWRLDVDSATISDWGVPSSLIVSNAAVPLFTARDTTVSTARVQPITAPLSAALNTDGKPIILFGTGTFYQTGDKDLSATANQRIDSFYGIIDGGAQIASNRSTLQEQTIQNQVTVGTTLLGRIMSNTAISSSSKGWYVDLVWKRSGVAITPTGERVVSRAAIRSGVVTFATVTPSSDPCTGGATSWIMSLDLFGGGRLAYNYFDFNGDGNLTDADAYTDPVTGAKIPYSGRSNTTEGAIKTPTFFNGTATDSSSSGKDLICFASSAGAIQCSPVPSGTRTSDRVSWREIR